MNTTIKNPKVPKLRFPGFEGEWEDIKLETIIEERREIPSSVMPLYSLTIEKGITPKTKRYERSFLVRDTENAYKVMHKDDFAYNPMNLRFGALARHKEDQKVLVSKYYNIFHPKKGISAEFLEAFLTRKEMIQFYDRMSMGTLEEKKRVHYLDFINFKKPFPTHPEQQKIASFLTAVDSWIDTLQKQKSSLEQYKKGMMQKLFNQEIRFKDENGNAFPEWKEKRLEQLFNEETERKGGQEFELLSVSLNNGVTKQDTSIKRDSSSLNKSNYKIVRPNQIAYNTMRMWQGASGVSQYTGIISPAYTVVNLKKGDINFYGYLFKQPRVIFNFYRYSQGLTSDTWNLKYRHFSEILVMVPSSIKEQQKIADFLSSIDNLITAKQKEIQKAETWKKGLMQGLFV